MKDKFISLLTVFLGLTVLVTILGGCSEKVKKDEEYLYNWLVENGQLKDATDLIYKEETSAGKVFTLHSDISHKLYVTYSISDYEGHSISVTVPLYSTTKKIKAEIYVVRNQSSSTLTYYHIPKDFTRNTPIEHDAISSSSPPLETILLEDYGEWKYENGKRKFYLDESKREEFNKKFQQNEEITKQREICENIAKDLSHTALCEVLDWLNEKVCPLAEMNISDLGYAKWVQTQ